MAGDNSAGSGRAYDEDQGVEVLRAGLLLKRMTLRALANNINHKFQSFKGHFDEIVNRLDVLALGANRNMNDDRW